jgi:hypothetical protein
VKTKATAGHVTIRSLRMELVHEMERKGEKEGGREREYIYCS